MQMTNPTMLSWITETLPWKAVVNPVTGKTFHRKGLHEDPETGIEVFMVRYGPGVHTPEHTHNCAHGLYVLSGSLVTHDGTYNTGDFVWFEEGVIGTHGANATEPVTVLFITNKPFDITFVE